MVDHKRGARQSSPMRIVALALLVIVAGCTTPRVVPPATAIPRSAPMRPTGLERVLGQDARALVALFGEADQDVREEGARRLQFAGPICILDAYLYRREAAEPVVTYVDARQLDGRDIDRASCVAALVRRKAAR